MQDGLSNAEFTHRVEMDTGDRPPRTRRAQWAVNMAIAAACRRTARWSTAEKVSAHRNALEAARRCRFRMAAWGTR